MILDPVIILSHDGQRWAIGSQKQKCWKLAARYDILFLRSVPEFMVLILEKEFQTARIEKDSFSIAHKRSK